MTALRYTSHLGYLPPELRPQFLETLGTADPAVHIHHAARIGLAGVLYPWAVDRPPAEQDTVRRALVETGLACSGIAALPLELTLSPIWTRRSRHSRTVLAEGILASSRLAASLGSTVLTVIVTADPDRRPGAGQHDDLVANLQHVLPIAEDHGLSIGIEPMLRMPAPLLRTATEAVAVIDRTGRPNVGLVYDTTHVAMMDGDLMLVLTQHFDRIVSLQLSDAPGRVEPGAGTLPLLEVATEAARRGYGGLVDFEHGWIDPTRAGEQVGLERLRRFSRQVTRAASAR